MRSEWNGPNRVVAHRYSVVYDGRTGRILHVHESRAIEGAQMPGDRVLEERALELAGRFSRDRFAAAARHLSVLTVDATEVDQDGPMKVDVRKRKLVSIPVNAPRNRITKKPASRRAKAKPKAKRPARG
jgi:hypothetical protein